MKVQNIAAAIAVATISLAALAGQASAATLASWTFEPPFTDLSNSATIVGIGPSTGTGVASGVHASADTDWTTPVGNGSSDAFSANTWAIGDYFQFITNTSGNSDITLSWDQVSSGTGPRDFAVQYSTNGVSYSPLSTYVVLANSAPNPVWNATTSSSMYSYTTTVTGISTASIYFRLAVTSTTSAAGGTIGTGGTSRVDNVVVTGVPEPATLALAAFGLVGVIAARRRS